MKMIEVKLGNWNPNLGRLHDPETGDYDLFGFVGKALGHSEDDLSEYHFLSDLPEFDGMSMKDQDVILNAQELYDSDPFAVIDVANRVLNRYNLELTLVDE